MCGVDPRRHRQLIHVLLPHGSTVQMKEGNIKRVFWQTPPLHLPRDWERRPHGLIEQMARLDLADLVERERSQGPEAAVAAVECHRCPWGSQTRCDQEWKGLEGLERRLAQKSEMLEAFRSAYWRGVPERGGRPFGLTPEHDCHRPRQRALLSPPHHFH